MHARTAGEIVGLGATGESVGEQDGVRLRRERNGNGHPGDSIYRYDRSALIAAVAGILFGGESALQGFAAVGAENVPMKILEAKLALVLICLARGFLDFIWALRQMNYALALIGAAPEIHTKTDRKAFSEAAGQLLLILSGRGQPHLP